MDILLTNDDGIDSPGLRALYEALSSVGDVLVVAPAADQSAVGRALSYEVDVEQHEIGYAIEGTPADCVVAGLEAIGPYPDLIVAGCNRGANLGAYVLGRSGTVSAAVEGAFFGLPSIAVSLCIPGDADFANTHPAVEDYAEAARATAYLAERAMDEGVFDEAEYLNVNAPMADDGPAPMAVTRPSHTYDMTATHEADGTITLTDRIWEHMRAGDLEEPEGTDRHAVMNGRISVSPLTAPHTTEHHPALDELADAYPGD
ncbi:MAG: 5'/3'-nucleotidase SurE [Halobacteriales archaeon]|nr:5'/3'-nucleotidase SurE [Halobacteriales archaeon]